MSQDLCQMALRQMLELASLTDATLVELSRRKYTGEEMYREVLGQVLGGNGRRGPFGVLLAQDSTDCTCCTGRIFQLKEHQLFESSGDISIDPSSSYALDLVRVERDADAVAVNWMDLTTSVEKFQGIFHPEVLRALDQPIRNFVSCRISGVAPGVIVAFNYPGRATEYDADVLRSAAAVMGSLVTVSGGMRETEQAFLYTISALARACEAAEEDTGKHIVRVNRYAGALAANMGFNTAFVDDISNSAQLHDVGKMRIPVEILLKKGPLNRKEMQLMRQHPAFGTEIIGDAPRLLIARELALSHHENWDGTGYPKRLKGERIPLSGRIVKVADVYDALRSKRSYKPPMTHQEALEVFRVGDARINPELHFDPAVLQTFFKIEHMFDMIYDSMLPKIGLKPSAAQARDPRQKDGGKPKGVKR